jgi:DNA-binding response OmpR family regulator
MATRILLVEDDPDVKMLTEHVLLSAGYEVQSVETVLHAKALIQRQPFALVLADGTLADGSGIEVADLAVAMGVRAAILTGNALRIADADRARHEILLKPMRPVELLATIERLLADRGGGADVVPIRRPS